MCHPQGQETRFRIAAKAMPRRNVAKAHHTLDSTATGAALVKAMYADADSEATTEVVAKEALHVWQNRVEVNIAVCIYWPLMTIF